MYVLALYGVSVNYSGNCLYDEHTSRSICKLSLDFDINFCEHIMLVYIINPHFHIDFCEHDAHTNLPTSVGLAQAHPNKQPEFCQTTVQVVLISLKLL